MQTSNRQFGHVRLYLNKNKHIPITKIAHILIHAYMTEVLTTVMALLSLADILQP